MKRRKVLTPLERQRLVQDFRTGVFKSVRSAARAYEVSDPSVKRELLLQGLTPPSISDTRRGSLRDDAFASLDNEQAAYFFGLIMADGCITRQGTSKRLQIGLIDRELVEALHAYLETTNKIYDIDRNGFPIHQLSVTSSRIYNDLVKFGCCPKKSLTMKYPKSVPAEMQRHFVRGYFDGDGHIGHNGPKEYRCHKVEFVGTVDFLAGLAWALVDITRHVPLVQKHRHTTAGYLRYTDCQEICSLRDWMYDGATLFLNRKRDKFPA